MDTEYWKSSPFGENSIFHPKWDEKEKERRQQQIEPAKITGIEIKQGTLKEDSYIGPRYDNLYPQKNHPDTIKNSFISVPIIVTISTSGYASTVFISIGNNWEQAHPALSKIGIFQKSFTIQVSSSTRKGIFDISAKIADSLDDTPCDIKKYKVVIGDNGRLLEKEEIEEKKKDELTIEIIKQITPLCSDDNILKHLSGINQAIEKNNINTYLRKVHFLTQLIYESGYLKYTKEIGVTEQSYEGFYGRGLMQLTGKSNYLAYQDFCGEDVTSSLENRQKIERPPHAAISAGWYWDYKNLNKYADNNDFIMITSIINGGFNGFEKRLALLKKVISALSPLYDERITSDYIFEKSAAYFTPIYCFAWGLWHDPDLNKEGCIKDKQEALKGYQQMLNLIPDSYVKKNRYNVHKIELFNELKDKNGDVNIKDVAIKRISDLSR